MMRKKEVNMDFSDKYIRWFSQLNSKDVLLVGGKGASLSEMYNHKFPVPLGFMITSKAFEFFLEKEKLKPEIIKILSVVDLEDTAELEKASKQIRELMESKELPKELEEEIIEAYHILSSEDLNENEISESALNILRNAQEPIFVSVRSSATKEDSADASFAGQQDSFLNVKGSDSLLEHIKRCFSSLYTSRAIYYRNKKGFKESETSIAVVVQKMVDSEKSGVVFSKNPMDLSDDIIVEAVFGLGEGIVSGRIHPDNYIATRDLKVKSVKVSDKKIAVVRKGSGENAIVDLSPTKSKSQVLSNGQILKLADYAIKLEKHYQKPQDIEFAIEDEKVYIVQSRPITTLEIKQQIGEIVGKPILEGLGASPGVGVGVVKIINNLSELHKIEKGDVLVTKMTNPDMVVSMQKSVAIVTDEGGMTAHASIVSREMGIPCVVGTRQATSVLKEGMKITVDGSNGKIYEGEVAETSKAEIKPVVETNKIKIKVIVDLPDFAERAAQSKIHEIGLCRLEGMITSSGKHPLFFEKQNELEKYTAVLSKGIGKIVEHFHSIWIRASDVRTDEFSSLEGAPEKEINPMLGLHGIRFSLKHPKILEAELLAIKEVAKKHPSKKFGIMFPQIISIEEVKKAKEYFEAVKVHNMEFGVMIETPAAVQIIEEICSEVDFISLGTNDLTQYTLAVDRGEDKVQHLYNEIHPAVFSQIEKVIDACKKTKTESSICGQAGSNKEMVEFLVKKGIDSISVNADAGYDISVLVAELEKSYVPEEVEEERVENVKEEKVLEEVKEEVREEPVKKELPKIDEENWKIPDEDWKRLTRKEKRKLRRKMLKKRKRKQNGNESLEQDRQRQQDNLIEKEDNLDNVKQDLEKENFNNVKQDLEEGVDAGFNKGEVTDKKDENQVVYSREFPKDKLENSENLEDSEGFLSKEKIQIPAEFEEVEEKDLSGEMREQEGVKPIDNLNRIEDKAEDIQEEIEEEKQEKIQENEVLEESIGLGDENVDNVKQEPEVKELEDEGESNLNEEEDRGVSGEPVNPENMGVYNPNEESDNTPQKMEYRFDEDDEDIYSDVF